MQKLVKKIRAKGLARGLKRILSLMLLALAAVLVVFLVKETWILIRILLDNTEHNSYELIEAIIIWFLYFEFIALIAKYFESKFHFPLRYFIYIGVTAIVRLVIVYHEKPMSTLIFSLSILVLLCALYIANTSLLKRI